MADWRDQRVSLAGTGTLAGVAASDSTSGACVVNVRGIEVAARIANGLTITTGDKLLLTRQGSLYWIFAVTVPAPAVPPAPAPPPENPPDTGDAPPDPKPVIQTGTLVCVPVATSCYRDGHWRTDIGPIGSTDLFQGRYGGSSFGRSTGVAFYGSKPRSIAGATVTKATIKVKRLSAGDFSARSATLRLVSQTSRPGGAPTLNETTSGPSLKVNETTTSFTIPNGWAQAMVNGTRGGIAISIGSDDPYIQLAGRGSWSAAMTLAISWRRTP